MQIAVGVMFLILDYIVNSCIFPYLGDKGSCCFAV